MCLLLLLFFVGFCSFFGDRCFYIATTGLEPMESPSPPRSWNYRCVPLTSAFIFSFILVWFAFRHKCTCMFIHPLPSQLSGQCCVHSTSLASCPSILHGGSLWGPFSLLLYVNLGLDWFCWRTSACFQSVPHCSLALMLSDAFVCVFWEQGPRSMELLEQRVCWYFH